MAAPAPKSFRERLGLWVITLGFNLLAVAVAILLPWLYRLWLGLP